MKVLPALKQNFGIELDELRAENVKLRERIGSLEMEVDVKNRTVEELSAEKSEALKKLNCLEKKLSQYDVSFLCLTLQISY